MRKIFFILILLFFYVPTSNAMTEDESVLGLLRPIKGFEAKDFFIPNDFSLYQNQKQIASNGIEKPLTTWHSLEYNLDQASLFLLSKNDLEVPDRMLWIYEKDLHSYRPACNNHAEMFMTDGQVIYYWCDYQCQEEDVIERLDLSNSTSDKISVSNCDPKAVLKELNATQIVFKKAKALE